MHKSLTYLPKKLVKSTTYKQQNSFMVTRKLYIKTGPWKNKENIKKSFIVRFQSLS